jgi:CelD/BcsL family acetyltransferase involved in cellulose biosynthesis
VYSDLSPAIVPQGLRATQTEGTLSPYLGLREGWEEICASGPSQLRHTRRAARKFAREGGVIEQAEHRAPTDVVKQIAEVEAHSWKARRGVAQFQPGAGQRLLQDVLVGLGARHEITVWMAHLNGRPIAYLVNFATPDRIWFYQGSYREDCRQYYAGGVLHFHAIKAACDAGLTEYDFLNGDEEYKGNWTTGSRTLRYLAVYPDTMKGKLAFASLVAPRWRLRQSKHARAVHALWIRLKEFGTPADGVAGR